MFLCVSFSSVRLWAPLRPVPSIKSLSSARYVSTTPGNPIDQSPSDQSPSDQSPSDQSPSDHSVILVYLCSSEENSPRLTLLLLNTCSYVASTEYVFSRTLQVTQKTSGCTSTRLMLEVRLYVQNSGLCWTVSR